MFNSNFIYILSILLKIDILTCARNGNHCLKVKVTRERETERESQSVRQTERCTMHLDNSSKTCCVVVLRPP